MATFTACVRKKRKDGLYPVYIRVCVGTEVTYMKTDKLTTDAYLSSKGEIKDPYVMRYCSSRISTSASDILRSSGLGYMGFIRQPFSSRKSIFSPIL